MTDLAFLDARRPAARRALVRIAIFAVAGLVVAATAWVLHASLAPTPERLLDAVRVGDAEAVQDLLASGVPADARAERPWPVGGLDDTPLLWAAGTSRADIVELLLDAGADPNLCDEAGSSPLTRAAGSGSIDVVDLLLSRGAVPDGGVVGNGWTALHSAALADRLDVVHRFLAHGADPELAANDGRRPVHVALERGSALIAASVARPDSERDVFEAAGLGPRGRLVALLRENPRWIEHSPSPLENAPLLHLAALCGNVDSVDALLDAGADPGARGPGRGLWSGTALHLAAERGCLAAARRLLDGGAPADANLGRGTPLHFAAAAGRIELVRLLLDRGAFLDARQQGPDSGTPLHFAAANGRADVVELLLARGADRTATTRGVTALSRALKSGDARTIELLRAR